MTFHSLTLFSPALGNREALHNPDLLSAAVCWARTFSCSDAEQIKHEDSSSHITHVLFAKGMHVIFLYASRLKMCEIVTSVTQQINLRMMFYDAELRTNEPFLLLWDFHDNRLHNSCYKDIFAHLMASFSSCFKGLTSMLLWMLCLTLADWRQNLGKVDRSHEGDSKQRAFLLRRP